MTTGIILTKEQNKKIESRKIYLFILLPPHLLHNGGGRLLQPPPHNFSNANIFENILLNYMGILTNGK